MWARLAARLGCDGPGLRFTSLVAVSPMAVTMVYVALCVMDCGRVSDDLDHSHTANVLHPSSKDICLRLEDAQ